MKKHYTIILSFNKFKIEFTTLLLIFCSLSLYAQTQGPNDAGIGFTSGGGTNWSNPGYITADDFDYASANLGGNGNSRSLRGRDYGFTIPAGATINGIQVSIMRSSSSNSFGNSIDDRNLRLVKNGTVLGNNYASNNDWPTSMAVANYGGPSDLWGTTWTPAEINNINFGVALSVENESGSGRTAFVDYIQITVYYTLPITITNFSPTSTCTDSGDLITINGTNLSGVTNVYFNGTSASFTIINSTQITATVPSGATSGTISVTSPSGNATSTGSFTIHPLPSVNPITGITDLCPFTTTTLSNTTLGGVWSSGNTSVATVDASGIVSGVSSGSSLITYTVTDGNSCSNSATITVNVTAPPILSGPTEVCLGNTIQLLPSSSGTWISNNPSVATIDNTGLVSGILLGNSTFTFTDSVTGCFATTGTIEVVQSPQITLQPIVSQTACSSNSVSISTSADGSGLTYQWFKGAISLSDGGNISGANTPTLTLNPVSLLDDGTDYYCEITGNCTPSVTTDFATIIVNENVAIGTQPIVTQTLCSNDTATFSVIANGTGLSYQWYNGVTALVDDAFISGATTASLSISSLSPANSSTEYYCVVSGTSPCNPVTSDYSILIVNDFSAITLEPAITQTVCAGESVNFTINATG